jgi:hypothetical protein
MVVLRSPLSPHHRLKLQIQSIHTTRLQMQYVLCFFSADLPTKYWEYAFYLFLRIYTIMPHASNKDSLYFKATNKHADLSRLRIFGRHIYALGTSCRFGKLTTDNIARGIVLGHGGSIKK